MMDIVALTHRISKHPYVSVFMFLTAVVALSQRRTMRRVDVNDGD